MNRKETVTLEDVLDEIVLQEFKPTHEALTRWCVQYPEHKDALAQFFATWGIQDEQTEIPAIDEDVVASRMVSHALNLLHSQATAANAQEQAAPEVRLHKMIRASGLSGETLETECGLDQSLLAKLDRHLILVDSVPRLCIERLAMALRCAAEFVVNAISGEPILLYGYKSKGKPVSRQEAFLDAVATSSLPDSKKQEWQRIAAGDRLD